MGFTKDGELRRVRFSKRIGKDCMMKKTLLAVLAALAMAGAVQAGLVSDEPGEFAVQGQYWFPGEGDFNLFDAAYGAQVSWREWVAFPFGMTLSAGVAQWQADSGATAYKFRYLDDFDGDVTLIPLGLSLVYCPIDWNNWDLILETGLHYVLVDSSVDCRNKNDGTRHEIDMDNAIWWTTGAEFDYQFAEGAFFVCGAGVQVDVLKAESEYDLGELRDTRFQAFYAKAGLKFLF